MSTQKSVGGLSVSVPIKLTTLNGLTLINLDAFGWSIIGMWFAPAVTIGPERKKLLEFAASNSNECAVILKEGLNSKLTGSIDAE